MVKNIIQFDLVPKYLQSYKQLLCHSKVCQEVFHSLSLV